MIGLKTRLIKLTMYIILVAVPEGLCTAQTGWDKSYSFSPFPGFNVTSGINAVLPDTARIVVMGFNLKDSFPANSFSGLSTFLASVDYNGNLQWKKQLLFQDPVFAASEPLLFHLLAKVKPGTYVTGANSYDFGALPGSAMSRPFLYYFTANGDSVRFAPLPYNSKSRDVFQLFALTTDKQHNVLTSGSYWNNYNGDTSGIWLAKFDQAGNFLWRRIVLDTPYYHTRVATHKILLGNRSDQYLFAGLAVDPDTARQSQYCIWKTDTAGKVLWRRNLPKTRGWASDLFYDDDTFFDIINARNGSGYYFITVAAMPVRYPNADIGLATAYYCGKLDEDGKVVWSKIYQRDSLHDERSTALIQQPNGDLLFMGETAKDNEDQSTMGTSLFATDSMGNLKWMKIKRRYNCPYPIRQRLRTMKLSPDNRMVGGGYIYQFGPQPGCYDTAESMAWLVLTDSLGRTHPGDTLTYPLQVIEVVSPTTVTPAAKDDGQLLIYPNPAKDLVHIELRRFTGAASDLSLQLYDGSGRLLLRRPLNSNKTSIDLAPYSPGFYYIRVSYKDKDIGGGKLIKK